MNAFSIRRSALLGVAAALGFSALLAAGCSKKIVSVDPDFTAPEGTANEFARMVVYDDRAIPVYYFSDFSPPGPDPNDLIDSIGYVRRGSAATLNGLILDGTPASGYQVFRREEGGGMAPLQDFVAQPSARWVDREWEIYAFRDDDPTRIGPPTYQARGLLAGVATARSPVTNTAALGDTSLPDIGLRIAYGSPPNEPYIDSLFTLRWNAVPGAVGYYLHVFQFRSDLRDELERTLAGTPSPFFVGKSKDFYAAFLPAGVTQYKLGGPEGITFTRRQTFYGQNYFARVSAVDTLGRMIAFSSFSSDPQVASYRIGPYENGYTLQPLGAIIVSPSRPPIGAPAGASRVRAEAPFARGTVRAARVIESDGQRYLHFER